jgi:tRNA nucleotidyltransferase (CCA-adding enzyme)
MKIYLVGGAVRDQLLGLTIKDKDWVVVGGSTQEMLALGYRPIGKNFPVFLHSKTQEEYALARRERKVSGGYQGFEFDVERTISLQEDLSRRDLTINAMAMDNEGNIIDFFNAQKDLKLGLLRHVSGAFCEDPVRILRVARFASRFHELGFKVAHTTHRLMCQMVDSKEVDNLVPERVFQELAQVLNYSAPSTFFKVLSACNAYARVFFPLKVPVADSHQNVFLYLDELAHEKPEIKFAIWLKEEPTEAVKTLCRRLKCPKKYQQLAKLSSEFVNFFQNFEQQDSLAIFNFFQKTDALRRSDRFFDLLKVFYQSTAKQPLLELYRQFKSIDIKTLDSTQLGQAIQVEKKRIIQNFLSKS